MQGGEEMLEGEAVCEEEMMGRGSDGMGDKGKKRVRLADQSINIAKVRKVVA